MKQLIANTQQLIAHIQNPRKLLQTPDLGVYSLSVDWYAIAINLYLYFSLSKTETSLYLVSR